LLGDVAAVFDGSLVELDSFAQQISEVTETVFNGVVVACWDLCINFVVKLGDVCDFFVFVVVATGKDVF